MFESYYQSLTSLARIFRISWEGKKLCDGGEGGIRTPGTRKRTIDFESTALDHSATSPKQMEILK